MPRVRELAASRTETMEQLRDMGYSFGYATYWNANVMTYVTNGALSVAPIVVDEAVGGTGPFPLGCPHDYFQNMPGRERKFLLLSAQEEQDWGYLFGQPILQNDYYTAYDYPHTLLTQ